MPFKYKKVLVIGATSGIGEGLADKFVSEGSFVIAVGRRQENLESFAQAHGGSSKVDTAIFDITDLKNIPKFTKDITEKHPDLDCVVFNSGIQRHLDWTNSEAVDLSLVELELTTNYTSYLHLTKSFLPFLQSQTPKEVSLVYVTSGLALVPLSYCPGYCASKAAVHHMVLALRMQLKASGSNVKVIELLPPMVQTELHDDKHQPEFAGRGGKLGMPLAEFVEEAYEGLNAEENEQVPVQDVRTVMGFDGWERTRQEAMVVMNERARKRNAA